MMLFTLSEKRPSTPGGKVFQSLYQILGTDAIHGLRRRLCHYDYEVGQENVYRIWPESLYETQVRYTDANGACIRVESRYYYYGPEGLREIFEDELLQALEEIKSAARMLEHPDGGQS